MDAAPDDRKAVATEDGHARRREDVISTDVVGWIFDHIPNSRIFEAFSCGDCDCEDSSNGPKSILRQPATLFDACMRAVMPFAAVCEALQARLPVLDFDPRQGRPDPSERTDVTKCPSDHWVVTHPGDDGQGRLRPISQRDAQRIALWHWAGLVTLAYTSIPPVLSESLYDAENAMPSGYRYGTWLQVTGQWSSRGYVRTASKPAILVKHMLLNRPDRICATTYHDTQDLRAEGSERGSVQTFHPWGDHIHVHAQPMYIPGELPRVRIVGWVDGDDDFVLFSGFEVKSCLF